MNDGKDDKQGTNVSHFWYNRSRHLKVNIEVNDTLTELVLTPRMMANMVSRLNDGGICDERGTRNTAWWNCEGEDRPGVLYRDDAFSVTLPHEVGVELRGVLEGRLRELLPTGNT